MSETKLVRDFEYPSNSEKSKNIEVDPIREKKVDQIVKSPVIRQKKSLGQKFSETFLGDDTRSVGDYILHDVLIPAAKATLSEMVGGGIEMLLFGERRSRGSSTIYRDRDRSYVPYNKLSRSRDDREPIRINRSRSDLDDIIIESRGEAEEVLDNLVELIKEYNVVSVADYYDMLGVEANFTDNKYGWTNLRDATVERGRRGYYIRLPRPREI